MKLKSFIYTGLFFASASLYAQSNILNAKIPEEIGMKTEAELLLDNDKPLEYGYVGDRDILFSKMVWEKVVLDERVNFPLYFPVDGNLGDDRKSLYQVLKENLESGMISKVYRDDYFTEELTLKELQSSLKASRVTDGGIEYMNQEGITEEELPEEFKVQVEIKSENINSYQIKGLWYFDKRQGELKYRILAIAPTAPDAQLMVQEGDLSENNDPIPLFWVFYPEVREILHEAKAFNNDNSASPISFDHLLNSRRFHGIIYKEENVYGDREIKEYVAENALMQLLESERIKDKIRDFEQDMWSY